MLYVDDDQTEAVLIFGQTWDSVDEDVAFTLNPKPNRGIVKHLTFFYRSTVARVQVEDLKDTPHRLTREEYRRVVEFWTADEGSST